jgi:hypothetical protein
MQRTPALLALPPELRHKIFILVVAFTPATVVDPRTLLSCAFHGICRSDLSILLTSRQIHAETRLLPFQCNKFAFPLWFGSSVFAAIRFLKALRPFQVDALRHVELKLTRADLGVLGRVEDLCGLLVIGGGGEGCGLQRLEILLDDEGGICEDYAAGRGDLLDVERGWIECGLARLRNVKRLRIDVESGFLGGAGLGSFGEDLRETMPWIERLGIGVMEVEGKDGIEEGDSGVGRKTLN